MLNQDYTTKLLGLEDVRRPEFQSVSKQNPSLCRLLTPRNKGSWAVAQLPLLHYSFFLDPNT